MTVRPLVGRVDRAVVRLLRTLKVLCFVVRDFQGLGKIHFCTSASRCPCRAEKAVYLLSELTKLTLASDMREVD